MSNGPLDFNLIFHRWSVFRKDLWPFLLEKIKKIINQRPGDSRCRRDFRSSFLVLAYLTSMLTACRFIRRPRSSELRSPYSNMFSVVKSTPLVESTIFAKLKLWILPCDSQSIENGIHKIDFSKTTRRSNVAKFGDRQRREASEKFATMNLTTGSRIKS